jgi:hypothetical protein
MSSEVSGNRWWRWIPKSTAAGWTYAVLWAAVIVIDAIAVATRTYNGGLSVGISIAVIVLAAWNLLRSITGLAALRRR